MVRIALNIEPSPNLATRHGKTICLDVLALMLACHSDRHIEQVTGLDRGTVSKYRQRWRLAIAERRDRDDMQIRPLFSDECKAFAGDGFSLST